MTAPRERLAQPTFVSSIAGIRGLTQSPVRAPGTMSPSLRSRPRGAEGTGAPSAGELPGTAPSFGASAAAGAHPPSGNARGGGRGSSPRSQGERRCRRAHFPIRGPAPSGAHLHALLVALEEVGAGVPGAVALEEFLGKPAVEALVVLALHIGAGLPHAVHGDQPGSGRCGAASTSSRRAAHVTWERPRQQGSGDVASDAAGGAASRGSRQLPVRGERLGEGREPRERRADRAPGAPGPGRFPKPGRRGAATSGHRVRGRAPRRGHDWRGAHGVGAGGPVPVPTSGPRGGRQLCGRPAPELSPDCRGVLCGPPR